MDEKLRSEIFTMQTFGEEVCISKQRRVEESHALEPRPMKYRGRSSKVRTRSLREKTDVNERMDEAEVDRLATNESQDDRLCSLSAFRCHGARA